MLEQRIQKGPTKGAAKSFKFGDWIVIPWDGTDPHPGKNKPHKLAPTWQGPYKVTGPGRSDSLIAVIDPADLKPYEFPIARCRLYNLAPGDNPVEIIAWDRDEAIVEHIVDHYMPSNRRSEWRFLARFKGLGPEDDVWIPWSKANELPAMDDYSAAHKELNIPDNLNNPADIQRSAPGGRGVASKRRRL